MRGEIPREFHSHVLVQGESETTCAWKAKLVELGGTLNPSFRYRWSEVRGDLLGAFDAIRPAPQRLRAIGCLCCSPQKSVVSFWHSFKAISKGTLKTHTFLIRQPAGPQVCALVSGRPGPENSVRRLNHRGKQMDTGKPLDAVLAWA